MKKACIFILIIFCSLVAISAQETNGQFRERVYQIDDRFVQHWREISRDGYFESVDFETYVDGRAKASAYADYLSWAYDKVAQIFSSFLSREELRNHRERSDTMHNFSRDRDKWADGLTGIAELENDKSWEEAGYDFKSTWKEVYHTRKNFYYWRLENGASRL